MARDLEELVGAAGQRGINRGSGVGQGSHLPRFVRSIYYTAGEDGLRGVCFALLCLLLLCSDCLIHALIL